MEKLIQEPGKCPKCGSDNLEYSGDTVDENNCIGYPYGCKDCKATGVEWYSLTYTDTTINEDK